MNDAVRDSMDLERLRAEVKTTWDKLPPDEQAALDAKMRAAHVNFLAAQTAAPPRRELVALHNVLHDNLVAPGPSAPAVAAAAVVWPVDPDGQVKDPLLDYSAADPRWARCFVAWYNTGPTPAFTVGKAIQIADTAKIWILGDWGGANPPANSIGTAVKAEAAKSDNYVVHLGDVYYAGTNQSILTYPYEASNLVNVWPGAPGRSFTLDSNHEMYAHAEGYVRTALPAQAFQAQGGNCFALYNNAFRIVGLDTAYYAPDQSFYGFMQGTLGPSGPGTQMQFLQNQIGALQAGQTLILLTHHNGLNFDGSVPKPSDDAYQLWQEVTQLMQQIPAGAGKNVWWYWGHQHAGIVYPQQAVAGTGITISPRCCGHSCIPWGISSVLTQAKQAGKVTWFENKVLGPQSNYFVANGYASLALTGTKLGESFWNQQGAVSWSSP